MFRFTIRDMLWLMVVVGLAIAFGSQYQRADYWQAESTLWQSRAESAASALKAADRQNAWHESNVVVVEPNKGVPIQRLYKAAK